MLTKCDPSGWKAKAAAPQAYFQGFGESGDLKGLYAKHGLDADGIARSVRKFLGR